MMNIWLYHVITDEEHYRFDDMLNTADRLEFTNLTTTNDVDQQRHENQGNSAKNVCWFTQLKIRGR